MRGCYICNEVVMNRLILTEIEVGINGGHEQAIEVRGMICIAGCALNWHVRIEVFILATPTTVMDGYMRLSRCFRIVCLHTRGQGDRT